MQAVRQPPSPRSYGVVAAYGLADTLDKGRKAAQQFEAPASSPAAPGPRTPRQLPFAAPLAGATALCESAADLAGACSDCLAQQQQHTSRQHLAGSAREQQSAAVPVAAAVLDTALWHGTASLAIPGFMINRCGGKGSFGVGGAELKEPVFMSLQFSYNYIAGGHRRGLLHLGCA